MECDAIVGREPGEYGFRPVKCTQVVGVRGYWAQTEPWENTGHFVVYCANPGHERNVRRRFAEVDPPQPSFLHETFIDHPADATVESEYDAITVAKWTRDREESWTA